jgi:hypothetical protein
MNGKETRDQIEAKINAHAWKDHAFKKRLLENPRETLKEMGLVIPAHAHIFIHEEAEHIWHLTIRKEPPNAASLPEETLGKLAAGGLLYPL